MLMIQVIQITPISSAIELVETSPASWIGAAGFWLVSWCTPGVCRAMFRMVGQQTRTCFQPPMC
jgi:hypothetical protein